jgi:hypothetical protein
MQGYAFKLLFLGPTGYRLGNSIPEEEKDGTLGPKKITNQRNK